MVSIQVGTDSEERSDRNMVLDRLREILGVLPSREEAARRASNFWRESVWYNNLLQATEFNTIYEPAVYAPTPGNPLTPHKLACLLMVLTLEAYLDLSEEAENPAVAVYWEAAQRCFDTRFGWAASVAGVQAYGLATLFVGFGWAGAKAGNFHWLRMMTSAALQVSIGE
jgi:hypothetical protein